MVIGRKGLLESSESRQAMIMAKHKENNSGVR